MTEPMNGLIRATGAQTGSVELTGAARNLDVLIVEPDGTVREDTWTAAADGGVLEPLQRTVGGLVDVVALTDDVDLWVNDEGIYLCEPNPIVTLLAIALGHRAPFYGPAVFTGGADREGHTLGLEPQIRAQLVAGAELAAADQGRLTAVTVDAVLFASRYR